MIDIARNGRRRQRSRRKLRILALLGVASLGLGLATEAIAQRAGTPRRGQTIERVLERHADRLDLDKATRKKMRSLSLAGRKAIRAHRDEIQERREQMNELLAEDAPDRAAVMAKIEEIGALELEVQKQHLTTMLDIRDLLSEEQRAELRKIHDEMLAESGGGVASSAPEEDEKESSE